MNSEMLDHHGYGNARCAADQVVLVDSLCPLT